MSDDNSPWLTVREAGRRAKRGAKLIYREIKAGRLRAARIGNRRDLRIHIEWVDQWLEASTRAVEIRRSQGIAQQATRRDDAGRAIQQWADLGLGQQLDPPEPL